MNYKTKLQEIENILFGIVFCKSMKETTFNLYTFEEFSQMIIDDGVVDLISNKTIDSYEWTEMSYQACKKLYNKEMALRSSKRNFWDEKEKDYVQDLYLAFTTVPAETIEKFLKKRVSTIQDHIKFSTTLGEKAIASAMSFQEIATIEALDHLNKYNEAKKTKAEIKETTLKI